MTPRISYVNPCPSIRLEVPILNGRLLPMRTVHRPETTNLGFFQDPNRWRLRDYFAEAFQVAGAIFAGGVLPTLIVVLCFAWGS